MFEEKNNNLTLSWQGILRLYLPIFLIFTLWYFRSLILIVILAFILASLLEKPIDYLDRKIKSRFWASLIVYLLIICLFSFLIYYGAVVFLNNLDQIESSLGNLINLKAIYENIKDFKEIGFGKISLGEQFDTLIYQIFDFIQKSFNVLGKVLGGTFTAFLVVLLSFFINTEKNGIEKGIRFLVPWQYEEYAVYLWTKARKKVSSWFFSQIILSIFVGLGVYFILTILGFPRAEFLGLVAGVLDFIPYLGPIIAFFILALFLLSENLVLGIIALFGFIVVQLVEGLVAPSLRAKAMKMNPLIIILSLLIGGKLLGVVGVIIILPLAATFVEFIKDWRSGRLESYLPQRKLI